MVRPYKKQAVQLRKEMKSAGFMISGSVDQSIELLLERLNQQRIEAAVEVTAKEHELPGVLSITQDYMIFAKRSLFLRSLYPDIFEVATRPNLSNSPHDSPPRMSLEHSLWVRRVMGGLEISTRYENKANNRGIHQIADFLSSGGRRPNDPRPKTIPGYNGPPL